MIGAGEQADPAPVDVRRPRDDITRQ